jgi:hypothetical protein
MWMKKPSTNAHSYAGFQAAFSAGGGVVTTFNLGTGANTSAYGYIGASTPTYTSTAYPNGWFRYTMTFTLTGASTSDANIYVILASNANGTSTSYAGTYTDFYVWGAQVELGSGASSYIPTGASQVTRNADLCYMSDISSLSYSATNGSMFYEGSFSKINSAAYPTRMGFLTAAGGDPAFEIFVNGTTIFSGIRSVPANNEITRTIATNTNYKFATSFNAAASSQVRCSINGAAVVGSGSSALTATRTPTVFGFTRSGYELYFPSGTIKSAKYWNTTLTDADLVSKST